MVSPDLHPIGKDVSVKESINAQILSELKAIPAAQGLEIPPKIFVEMGGRFLDYKRNVSMKASFPVFEKYEGPTGKMQGGIVTAAFDNTYGPFSYLVARKPCTSIDIQASFLRAVTVQDKELIVEVRLVGRGRNVLFMDGGAYNTRGKLVATSSTKMMVLGI